MAIRRTMRTRFRSGYATEWLNLRPTTTRRFILQKARRHPSEKRLRLFVGALVSGSISLPFRGSFRLSLTVLVHYRWQNVFSLRRWSSQIPARFLVSRGTWVQTRAQQTIPTGLSPPMAGRSRPFRNDRLNPISLAPQPQISVPIWFRLFPFRSPLLGESHMLSFPP